MIIRVTQEHIDKGKAGLCSLCPIALALKDAGFKDSWAGSGTLKNNKNTICITPQSCYDFMVHFDAGDLVSPFEFEIPDAA